MGGQVLFLQFHRQALAQCRTVLHSTFNDRASELKTAAAGRKVSNSLTIAERYKTHSTFAFPRVAGAGSSWHKPLLLQRAVVTKSHGLRQYGLVLLWLLRI